MEIILSQKKNFNIFLGSVEQSNMLKILSANCIRRHSRTYRKILYGYIDFL